MALAEIHTCDCCGKRRLCENDPGKDWWWYCRRQCLNASPDERTKIVKERTEAHNQKPAGSNAKFAYPIIGGPLDGKYAISSDFYQGIGKPGDRWHTPAGQFVSFKDEYVEYNSGVYHKKKIGGHPSMIFLHKPLLKPLIHPRDR